MKNYVFVCLTFHIILLGLKSFILNFRKSLPEFNRCYNINEERCYNINKGSVILEYLIWLNVYVENINWSMRWKKIKIYYTKYKSTKYSEKKKKENGIKSFPEYGTYKK